MRPSVGHLSQDVLSYTAQCLRREFNATLPLIPPQLPERPSEDQVSQEILLMQKVTKLKQRYGHEVHQRAMELAKAMGTCQKSYMWIIYGYTMIYATDTINRYIHIYIRY